MLKPALLEIFERDLRKLAEEVNLYATEADIWTVQPGIANSAGTLCLHLVGNLNHFIGALLGHTGYVRDRDSEFALRDVPRAVLLERIEDTIQVVTTALNGLPEGDFERDFPVQKHGQTVKTDFMLLHLQGHLSYHLGQVNYHRRLTKRDTIE
jgi:hypothetical protein